jgi:hypothetical protein
MNSTALAVFTALFGIVTYLGSLQRVGAAAISPGCMNGAWAAAASAPS